MRLSKTCAHDLSDTYGKLEKLTELARKKTIFDDDESSRELNKLVASIKSDIPKLKNQIELLQQVHKPPSSKKPKNIEAHSKNVVISLQQQLAKMSTNFKSTLEMRSQSLQQQKARREMFTSGPSSSYETSNNMNSRTSRQPHNSYRPQDTQTSSLSSVVQSRPSGYSQYNPNRGMNESVARNRKDPLNNVMIDMDSGGRQYSSANDHNSHEPGRLQTQSHLQEPLLNYEDEYLSERANTMQTIETTIVELGTVFNQLATMVQVQDEQITRIDTNISETAGNVEAAHEALLNYFASMSSNRWLILKVFGILFFFFVIFVIIAG